MRLANLTSWRATESPYIRHLNGCDLIAGSRFIRDHGLSLFSVLKYVLAELFTSSQCYVNSPKNLSS